MRLPVCVFISAWDMLDRYASKDTIAAIIIGRRWVAENVFLLNGQKILGTMKVGLQLAIAS